jgi:hypothetical protein
MLALWYNGISASHARARAAQLYHIFGNLSIGKNAQKAKSLYRLLLSVTKYFALWKSNRPLTALLSF